MHLILFNTHDVVLLITAYLCTMYALLLLMSIRENRTTHFLLAGFLFTQAAIPVALLVNYGAAFKEIAADFSPNIQYFFDLAYWLEGPFLLFYVRALIYKNYRLNRWELIYLIPFALYAFHQVTEFFFLPGDIKHAIIVHPEDFPAPSYIERITFLREIFRVALGFLCIYEIKRYRKHLKHHFSDTENIDLGWLYILCYGFFAVRIWAVMVNTLSGRFDALDLGFEPGFMGLVGNYTTFFLVSILIFYSLRLSSLLKGIDKPEESTANHASTPINDDDITKLNSIIADEKPFLTHSLTLNQLAKSADLSPRLLSMLINRHYEKTFFEFINYYRVEEAKRLLSSEERSESTVLDIMLDSGFSSKAAFNRFFKKYVGLTPSEYRKRPQNRTRLK